MVALLPKRARKSIGMTALIDVVFILLMFFMLTSTFARQAYVDLKSQGAAAVSTAEATSRWLVLHPDGRFSAEPSSPAIALDDPAMSSLLGSAQPLVITPMGDTRLQVIVTALAGLGERVSTRISLGKSIDVNSETAAQ